MKEHSSEQLGESISSHQDVQEIISTRAYEIYLNRGAEHGRDLEDWLQAESEVPVSLTMEGPVPAATVGEPLAADTHEATKLDAESRASEPTALRRQKAKG